MSKGFVAAEEGHIVQLLTPQAFSAAGTSDTFSMEAWAHATILLNIGVGSSTTVTVGECTAFTGSGRTALTFRSAKEATGGGDTLDAALAWASSITWTGSAAAPGGFAVIEIDADELTDGYNFIQVNIADPGTSLLAGSMAVLSGGRYQKDITATAIV